MLLSKAMSRARSVTSADMATTSSPSPANRRRDAELVTLAAIHTLVTKVMADRLETDTVLSQGIGGQMSGYSRCVSPPRRIVTGVDRRTGRPLPSTAI